MKKPFASQEVLQKVAEEYGTPYYIYDARGIRENARRLHAAFAWNPGFREFFAVKATPTPAILKLLYKEGCGADCATETELLLAEKCGFQGPEMMFSSNDTPAGAFRAARRLGATVNLDDLTHIALLRENGGVPETVSCRYNPGGCFSLGASKEGFQVMDFPRDAKFGFTRAQLTEGFRQLQALGAKRFGLHAFLASNTLSNAYYPALARILFQTAVELRNETRADIAFVNLSGGIGIPYRPGERENDISAIALGVRRAFEEILVPAGLGGVSVYTELGRYMLAPYGALVTRATREKHIYKEYIGVDACAADLLRPAMYGAYHHITVLGKEDVPCDHIYDVTGYLCENNDKFAVDRNLPKTEMGDLLFIHDAGAHGHSMGYNYNGALRSPELLLEEDGSVRLIRRRETAEDFFAAMIF